MKRLVILCIVAWSARALAYPQYQISRDVTCTACHLSPAGGGLLNENGLDNAENFSQWGTAPEFLNGLVSTPDWLVLGGDFRGAAGIDGRYNQNGPNPTLVDFPMQAELYAAATADAFSLHVTAGARDPQFDNTAKTLFASREHWLQWQQHPGENAGLYVRVGRFMPVYGLRLAEHPAYDREYGGTPLYGEAYAAAVEYIEPKWEVHATAFVHDPLQGTVELGDGGTVYAETRVASTTAVGVESKLDVTTDDRKIYGGVTAKQYIASPGVVVQAELEVVHDKLAAGGTNNSFVGYAMGTYFIGALLIDLGVGVYEPTFATRFVDQEAGDLDVHWFPTSHVELLLTNRLSMLHLGAGGVTAGYSLVQVHYRL